MTHAPTPSLWLCGPSAVGKSSVGWELFRQVISSGIKAAYIDLDQISFARPAPADDPENDALRACNLAAMWPNYHRAGARCLIMSGIVLSPGVVRMITAAVPDTGLTVCRLRASDASIRERMHRRALGGGPSLPGDELLGRSAAWLSRAAEDSIHEAGIMQRLALGDVVVDTDDLSVSEVAEAVRTRLGGWPN